MATHNTDTGYLKIFILPDVKNQKSKWVFKNGLWVSKIRTMTIQLSKKE